jgi:hypothetical protein
MVPFESFRPKLHTALIKGELRRSEAERRNSAGRKPWDEVVIFKALVLQALYNLSDIQVEAISKTCWFAEREVLSTFRSMVSNTNDRTTDCKRRQSRPRYDACSEEPLYHA